MKGRGKPGNKKGRRVTTVMNVQGGSGTNPRLSVKTANAKNSIAAQTTSQFRKVTTLKLV